MAGELTVTEDDVLAAAGIALAEEDATGEVDAEAPAEDAVDATGTAWAEDASATATAEAATVAEAAAG